MGEQVKPRFKVGEPVYIKIKGYDVKGVIKSLGTCSDCKDGIWREYYIYTVVDEEDKQICSDYGLITDGLLMERWTRE